MNRKILMASALLFLAAAFPVEAPASQAELPALYRKVSGSVVDISVYDRKGEELATGSGFFFGATNEIMTNYHVMEGAGSAEVRLADGRSVPAGVIIADDPDRDLLVFSLDTAESMGASLFPSDRKCEPGERVVVIGSPLGLGSTISDGIVSAVREETDSVKMIQITAPISSGSSGSPVVNGTGEVVGVATSSFDEGQNLNFAVPIEAGVKMASIKNPMKISDWSREAKNSGILSYQTGLGYLWAEEYEKAASFFEKAVKADPTDAEKQYYLGYSYFSVENYDGAAEALKASLAMKPDDPEALYTIGEVYYMQDEIEKALNSFRLAIKYSPQDHAGARFFLGVIYNEQKDREGAMSEYRKLKKLDSDLAADLLKQIRETSGSGTGTKKKPAARLIKFVTTDSEKED